MIISKTNGSLGRHCPQP